MNRFLYGFASENMRFSGKAIQLQAASRRFKQLFSKKTCGAINKKNRAVKLGLLLAHGTGFGQSECPPSSHSTGCSGRRGYRRSAGSRRFASGKWPAALQTQPGLKVADGQARSFRRRRMFAPVARRSMTGKACCSIMFASLHIRL